MFKACAHSLSFLTVIARFPVLYSDFLVAVVPSIGAMSFAVRLDSRINFSISFI